MAALISIPVFVLFAVVPPLSWRLHGSWSAGTSIRCWRDARHRPNDQYEVPLILSAVTVIMAAGSLSTVRIVEAQAGYWGVLPQWYVLTPWDWGVHTVMVAAQRNQPLAF